MEQRDITKAMLQYHDAALVAHAVSRANLTAAEWEVVDLREHGSCTNEKAAERLLISDREARSRYSSGMQKLDSCWGGLPWISSIIKQ